MKREARLDTEHSQRRQFIFRRVVLDNRPLSLEEMRDLLSLSDYDEQKIYGDIRDFEKIGCRIELRQSRTNENDREFVFLEGPHTDDDTVRETINSREKRLVARLAASLICGIPQVEKELSLPFWINDARKALDRMTIHFVENRLSPPSKAEATPEPMPASKTETPAEAMPSAKDREMAARVRSVLLHLDEKLETYRGPDGLETVEQVLKLLKYTSDALGKRLEALRASLLGFWVESSRMVALDSGTTNLILARFLKQLHIPVQGSHLCSLTVCTNSRRIFEELGPSDVWMKTIIVGGQQKFRSPTIAGAMAEHFLRSVSILQFGMCILGSTRVDLDRFAVCSDSQEESGIKNLLMDRSSLRIICVDNSKLQSGPGREGYRFASIDPKHIDLIVTNCPFRNSKNAQAEYDSFIKKVHAIEGRGVPVLVATSLPDTFDYPEEKAPYLVEAAGS